MSTNATARAALDIIWERLALPDVGELEWRERALCAQTDPEAFFPEKGGSTKAAKAVCHSCEVRQECLEYALTNDERYGIWGGLSEVERRRLRRARNTGAPR
jgi:WhiB family transcriptional regulator, redox-sensing transcriptional regulator